MERVLLLNASWEPLKILSMSRAICLLLENKVDLVETADGHIRSPSISIKKPSVIRLKVYIKIPFDKKSLAISRSNVLARDHYICGYCNKRATTVDHIYPKSKGGNHSWENVVAACGPCNGKKGNKTLKQLNWKINNKIFEPNIRLVLLPINNIEHERWRSWIKFEIPIA